MSKSKLPEQTNSEEIDLGQLFKLIGNAFDRLFRFIASIFIGIYKILLLLLIHIYKSIYWYTGAAIIGLAIGFFIDSTAVKKYGANMFVETNFNSSRQVYEFISQFHQLANKDRDSIELAKILNITPKEASTLKGFFVEPDLDENVMVQMYSDFFTRLDSLSRLDVTYDKYKESLTTSNFTIHMISVVSTDKFIYKKIEKAFIEQLSDNTYLNELVEVNQLNLEKKDEILLKEIQKTDSLLNEYLKIRINESKKEPISGAGTNLYMGDAESSNLIVNETGIIDKILELESERRQINTDKVTRKTVINVLANFPDSGYDIGKWYEKMKFIMPIGLLLITFLVYSIKGLAKYLDMQSKLLG